MRRVVIALLMWAASTNSSAQEPSWPQGLVFVKTRLDRAPAAGFVVQNREPYVFVVTSAHVVEGDPSPSVQFAPGGEFFSSSVRKLEAQESHGLALLVVYPGYVTSRISNELWFKGEGLLPMSEGKTQRWVGDSVAVAGFPVPTSRYSSMTAKIIRREGRDLVLDRDLTEGYSGGPVIYGDGVVGLSWGRVNGTGFAVSSTAVRAFLEGEGIDWPGGARTQSSYLLSDALEKLVGLWRRSDGGTGFPEAIRVFRRNPTGIDADRCTSAQDPCDRGELWTVSTDERSLTLYEDKFNFIRSSSLTLLPDGTLDYSYSSQSDTGPSSGRYKYRKVQ